MLWNESRGRRMASLAVGAVLIGVASVVAASFFGHWSGATGDRADPLESIRHLHNKEQAVLPESARKFIWEVERRAFGITNILGPRVTRALKRGERGSLLSLCTSGFQGQVPNSDPAERVDREFATFRWLRTTEDGALPVNAEQFVDWLLEYARRFRGQPHVQAALLYLSPTDGDRLDGAWTGTWVLRWYGDMETSGRGEVVMRTRFTCDSLPKDFAKQEAWVGSWQVEQVTEAQATHVLMQEMLAESGIDGTQLWDNWTASRSEFYPTSGGVYACDYNGDGLTDLLITDRKATVKLYANRGSFRFEDVSLAAGLPWDTQTQMLVAFADLDNDGDEDLILGTSILENVGARFRHRGALATGLDVAGYTVADYDRDGLVDIYVSSAAPDPHRARGRTSWVDDQSGLPNRLFRNRGDFQFEDVTETANAAAGRRSTFTSVWLDADEDGWPDLYVINELGPNVLLRNEHNGTFSEHQVGPAFDGFTMGVAAGDMDGDGHTDLYLGNMFSKAGLRIIANVPPDAYPPALMQRLPRFVSGNTLLRNAGGLRFDEVQNSTIAGVGWAYGPALVDLDGDGLLDIHSTCGFASFSRDEPDG